MGRLDGKIVWVTGAGSGIGEAAALALAREGAAGVVLTGRRREPLEGVARRIRPAAVAVEPGDVTVSADVGRIAASIRERFGRLDILVANAGTNVVGRDWGRLTPEAAEAVLTGNLTGAFLSALAVLPIMRAHGGGLLIHTASVAGRLIGLLAGPAYTAAKHGLVAMSHSINVQECVERNPLVRDPAGRGGDSNPGPTPGAGQRRGQGADAPARGRGGPDRLRRQPSGARGDQRGDDHPDLEQGLRRSGATGWAVRLGDPRPLVRWLGP